MVCLHLSSSATEPRLRPVPARRCHVRVFASIRRSGPFAGNADARARGLSPQHASTNALLSAGLALASSLVLLAAPAPALARMELPNKEVDDATSPLVQKLLQRTAENRERYAKERLQDYYRRNFKEYFEFEASTSKVAKARGLSPESAAAIQKWLQENK